MKRCFAGLFLSLTVLIVAAPAQTDESARANALYTAGKRLEALPLYEDLAKAHSTEWIYQERLADCLSVKASDSDPAEARIIRARVRDAAKRAVELGDPNAYIKDLADIDPNNLPGPIAPESAGGALLEEAEKSFRAGDYSTALAKYIQAADADPKLYQAPLYAGDMEFRSNDAAAAGHWFARAIQVNPNRETAYRYWGDALLRVSKDPTAARAKYIDAVVAEPYNSLSWQGLTNWAANQKGVVMAPKINRPAAPVADPKKPGNVTINIDPAATLDKEHPGASAWLMYSIIRASYQGDLFKKDFPDEPQYRHTLKEESAALSAVADSIKGQNLKKSSLDESLRNIVELNDAGMLDCWILINGADEGIAKDYDAYRDAHRQLLHDYLDHFVVHGGMILPQ